jgi:drug/metabolite transporter (DMT)-like permease
MTFPHQAAGIRRIYTMPYLLFVAAALFWSGNFVLGRVMHADIPPVALAFWRWSGAAVIVTCLAWPHLKRDWLELRRRWPIMLLLSLLGIAAMNTLLYLTTPLTSIARSWSDAIFVALQFLSTPTTSKGS